MKTLLMGMLAETFVHYGSDTGGGPIDLPVAREAGTDYPFIAGSGFKGALKDHPAFAGDANKDLRDEIFGSDNGNEGAGALMFSDARLFLLPVRSLTGAYKWVTCPHLLERLKRDCARGGSNVWPSTLQIPDVPRHQYRSAASSKEDLLLEELKFSFAGQIDTRVKDALNSLFSNEDAAKRLAARLIVLNDEDFGWFAKHGLAIHARNKLDVNKTSENLWYEEALPPDTLMYALVAPRNRSNDAATEKYLKAMNTCPHGKYLQVGGNETVGQGWFSVKYIDGGL